MEVNEDGRIRSEKLRGQRNKVESQKTLENKIVEWDEVSGRTRQWQNVQKKYGGLLRWRERIQEKAESCR